MRLLSRLNRPWVHFVLLGSLLYYLKGQAFPEPRPVIGPLSDARSEMLRQQWVASVGRPPTPEQLARMAAEELDRDMLFARAIELDLHLYDTVVYQRLLLNMRFLGLGEADGEGKTDAELVQQALDMRLHLGDEVVKRRLVQVMEHLLLASHPPPAPTEADIAAEFAQRREELRRPPRYSIEHIYFNREREDEAESVVATIRNEQLTPAQARELSSPFLPGYAFGAQSPDQLARHFGVDFVENLQRAQPQPGQWVGPVRSTYGLHYVWVEAIEPARDATLDEVRTQLQRDLESRARDTALSDSISALRQRYEVRS
jgi:hypothetical protein